MLSQLERVGETADKLLETTYRWEKVIKQQPALREAVGFRGVM